MRDKKHRLQTGGRLGKMGGEPGLDQAAHMANSRGQHGLKEFRTRKGGLRDQLAPAPDVTEAKRYSATCPRSQN